MKNITTSLYAIAKHDSCESLTAKREYPVFKISHRNGNTMVAIITDRGDLETWGAFHFTFIAKD